MQEEEEYSLQYEKAKTLLEKHLTWTEIHNNLVKDGVTFDMADEIVKQLKIITYAHKRKVGLNYIGIGAMLLLISFIYVCATFCSQTNFTYVMYGLTSAGLLLMFYGLYEMIG